MRFTPTLRGTGAAATPPPSTWDQSNRRQKRDMLRNMPRYVRKSVFGRWRWRQEWHLAEREAAFRAANGGT